MFVTETDEIWVTADFKETQLARMHRGEKVTIHVDTFGRNYHGLRRESAGRERRPLQPAAGRKRDRQLREGRAAPAGAESYSTPARIPIICCIPACRSSPRYGCATSHPRSSPAAERPPQRLAHNPWAIALTVTMATFMELLDTSIANVSLPHIAGGLGTSYDESTWVLTSYLVANAIILPMSAWLSRVFGRKRYYMICVALFTATSFLCGIAPSLAMLIFFRVHARNRRRRFGAGRAGNPGRHFPHGKRGGAFALYSMAIVTAPAIGPPLGGWITDNFSWRWVFFINVPIGILSLIFRAGWCTIRSNSPKSASGRGAAANFELTMSESL